MGADALHVQGCSSRRTTRTHGRNWSWRTSANPFTTARGKRPSPFRRQARFTTASVLPATPAALRATPLSPAASMPTGHRSLRSGRTSRHCSLHPGLFPTPATKQRPSGSASATLTATPTCRYGALVADIETPNLVPSSHRYGDGVIFFSTRSGSLAATRPLRLLPPR